MQGGKSIFFKTTLLLIQNELNNSLAWKQKVPSIYSLYRKLEPFDSKPAGKLYFKTNKLRHS